MPDKRIRSVDSLHVFAIAKVLDGVMKDPNCPTNCPCNAVCGCNDKPGCCENKCECHPKFDMEDALDQLSNPIFREVVNKLDPSSIDSLNDFQTIVDKIRKKILNQAQTSFTGTKKA